MIVQQGWSQQTAAIRQILSAGMRSRAAPRATRSRASKAKSRARSAPRSTSRKRSASSARSSKPARMVKGSAAAKRYMAMLRAKRKR